MTGTPVQTNRFSPLSAEIEAWVDHPGFHPPMRRRRREEFAPVATDMPVTQPASFVPTWADSEDLEVC